MIVCKHVDDQAMMELLMKSTPQKKMQVAHKKMQVAHKKMQVAHKSFRFSSNMTRSQFNHSYESGKWMKVKVAKCCWKK